MVPTGWTAEDNKYEEYMIIDGVPEKVGTWEVNLSDYALKSDLLNKVDKVDGERLITEEEAEKLNNLNANAEENYINSVSNDFSVTNKQLSLSESYQQALQTALDKKIDSQDGYGLLSDDHKDILDSLILNDGKVEVSGTINAESVIGLDKWLNDNSNLIAINQNQVTGLETKLSQQDSSIMSLQMNLQSFSNHLTSITDTVNEHSELLSDLDNRLTWQNIT